MQDFFYINLINEPHTPPYPTFISHPLPTQSNMTILYISHGGGPLPLLNDESHNAMVQFLTQLELPQPKSILVISAHWEEEVATITSHSKLIYDYYGFPKETYELTYQPKEDKQLPNLISNLLTQHNIKNKITQRGFDHGVFIPLMLMYPNADIPVTQLSLINGLDPKEHIELGKALSTLDSNILIIGSGFSFHNLREYSSSNKKDPKNDAFQDWLINTVTHNNQEELMKFKQAPYASYCHPREEHLIPLHVCVGAANKSGTVIFDDYIAGKRCVAFRW